MTRRAFFCDYRAPGFFMITITAAAGTPPLGHLSTDSCTPQIILSPLGELIRQSIENFTANTPEIRIPTYIIMPDHFHMLLHVRQRLPRHLGRIIGAFKGGISGRHAQLAGAPEVTPLFKPKFHYRIVTRRGQLDTLIRYISDNPRRLAIRRMHPDLFRRYNHLCIGTREYAAYGNIFLLKDFDRRPVMVHRAWTAGELQENERQCLACAANGGVLVSPLYQPRRKRGARQGHSLRGPHNRTWSRGISRAVQTFGQGIRAVHRRTTTAARALGRQFQPVHNDTQHRTDAQRHGRRNLRILPLRNKY